MTDDVLVTERGRIFISNETEKGDVLVSDKKDKDGNAEFFATQIQKQRELKTRAIDPKLDRRIVELAKINMTAARALPPPVAPANDAIESRWLSWQQTMYDKAMTIQTATEALHYAQHGVPFDHRVVMKDQIETLHLLRTMLLTEYPHFHDLEARLFDNEASIPETLIYWGGRYVSNILYWHLNCLFHCKTHAVSPRRIVEIGGGYGALARLWMHAGGVDSYAIVDLPESLFFAETALRSEFGDDVGYFDGAIPNTKITLVPVTRLQDYNAPCDLVINQGSLQEMNDTWVTFYMIWLNNSSARFFYSLNYAGGPLVEMFEARSFWTCRPSGNWMARTVNPDVPLVNFQSCGRNFYQALYEKRLPQERFENWSVLHGCALTRGSYLIGLELLRQEFTPQTAAMFMHVLAQNEAVFRIPKEALAIALIARDTFKTPIFDEAIDKMLQCTKHMVR